MPMPHHAHTQTPKKPYRRPAILHELEMETHAMASMLAAPEPGAVDPELPPKPNARPQDVEGGRGRLDPALPPKPAPRTSGGDGGGGRLDPPLPPKPPKP
jgi:hypothetical protein